MLIRPGALASAAHNSHTVSSRRDLGNRGQCNNEHVTNKSVGCSSQSTNDVSVLELFNQSHRLLWNVSCISFRS